MSIFEYLNQRTKWESLVDEYNIDPDRKQGTIDNLSWYIENGIRANRFRPGFEESLGIATMILKEMK